MPEVRDIFNIIACCIPNKHVQVILHQHDGVREQSEIQHISEEPGWHTRQEEEQGNLPAGSRDIVRLHVHAHNRNILKERLCQPGLGRVIWTNPVITANAPTDASAADPSLPPEKQPPETPPNNSTGNPTPPTELCEVCHSLRATGTCPVCGMKLCGRHEWTHACNPAKTPTEGPLKEAMRTPLGGEPPKPQGVILKTPEGSRVFIEGDAVPCEDPAANAVVDMKYAAMRHGWKILGVVLYPEVYRETTKTPNGYTEAVPNTPAEWERLRKAATNSHTATSPTGPTATGQHITNRDDWSKILGLHRDHPHVALVVHSMRLAYWCGQEEAKKLKPEIAFYVCDVCHSYQTTTGLPPTTTQYCQRCNNGQAMRRIAYPPNISEEIRSIKQQRDDANISGLQYQNRLREEQRRGDELYVQNKNFRRELTETKDELTETHNRLTDACMARDANAVRADKATADFSRMRMELGDTRNELAKERSAKVKTFATVESPERHFQNAYTQTVQFLHAAKVELEATQRKLHHEKSQHGVTKGKLNREKYNTIREVYAMLRGVPDLADKQQKALMNGMVMLRIPLTKQAGLKEQSANRSVEDQLNLDDFRVNLQEEVQERPIFGQTAEGAVARAEALAKALDEKGRSGKQIFGTIEGRAMNGATMFDPVSFIHTMRIRWHANTGVYPNVIHACKKTILDTMGSPYVIEKAQQAGLVDEVRPPIHESQIDVAAKIFGKLTFCRVIIDENVPVDKMVLSYGNDSTGDAENAVS